MDLQRLDLSDFRHGSNAQRRKFASQLVEGFKTRGFIKLDNHGFDSDSVRDMFDWNRRFFELPEQIRNGCAHPPGPSPQRGYSAIGGENLATYHSAWTGKKPPRGTRDNKELFDAGPAYDNEFPNRWPEDTALPGFRTYVETTHRLFEQMTMDILEALEVGMHITPGSLTSKCIRSSSELRMIHYPPMSAAEAQGGLLCRAWPHYDIGVISFLFQDDVGGLEIDDTRGGFEPVISDKPTDLIVNAAETLQRWTNGVLKAGLHRVTVPPSMKKGEEGSIPRRRSVVYFCKADRTASVAPLPDLVNEQRAARYDDLTFLAYHQKRLHAAYA